MRRSTGESRQEAGADSWLRAGTTTFGSFIKRRRIDRGLARSRVSEATGIAEDRLQQIEVSQLTPGYGDIKRLASALELPERSLLEAAGYVAPKSK